MVLRVTLYKQEIVSQRFQGVEGGTNGPGGNSLEKRTKQSGKGSNKREGGTWSLIVQTEAD